MTAAWTRGAAGAWHSPHPTKPSWVRIFTSVACVTPRKRLGDAWSSRFQRPGPPVTLPTGGISRYQSGGWSPRGLRITIDSTLRISKGPLPVAKSRCASVSVPARPLEPIRNPLLERSSLMSGVASTARSRSQDAPMAIGIPRLLLAPDNDTDFADFRWRHGSSGVVEIWSAPRLLATAGGSRTGLESARACA